MYKPEVDMQSDKPKMKIKKIGINDASTFPGFCSIHEQLFENFEKKGQLISRMSRCYKPLGLFVGKLYLGKMKRKY